MIYKHLKLSTFFFLLSLFLLTSCSTQESKNSLPTKGKEIHKVNIIAVGDSLTAGYNLPITETYPFFLEKLLNEGGFPSEVQNGGVSGETSKGTLSRANWILNSNPDLIILCTGGNDALRGLSPEEMKQNIKDTIKIFNESGVKVLLVGLKSPRNMGPDYVNRFDSVYSELAEEFNLDFMPFLLEDVALVKKLNQDDGIHPNSEGNEIIAQNLYQYIEKSLKT